MKEKKYIDLHVHSTISDGTYTPSELVAYAKEKNLYAMALTDHDSVEGVDEAKKAAGDELIIIPGVEISAGFNGTELHILGLNIDYHQKELRESLEGLRALRTERNKKIIEKMNSVGIPITEKIINERYNGKNTAITRAHFATYLIEEGYVQTKEEAFKEYLNKGGKCFVPKPHMEPEKAIGIIKKAGGHAVLAHPLLYKLDRDRLLSTISYLKELGIEGIEGIYSLNSSEDDSFLAKTAKRYGLYLTGGSDFHGAFKPSIDLGVGRGNLAIEKELLNNIM